MKSAFTFKLVGVEQLMSNLEELPTVAMKKTVLRNACKKALQPVADMARSIAPFDPRITKGFANSPHLRDTIEVSTKLKASQKRGRISDRSAVTVYVGSTAPHAHLVEWGTAQRFLTKPVVANISDGVFRVITQTGSVRPNPFMRPAWDVMRGRILPIFAAEMRKELNKAAARLSKRAAAGKLTKTQIRGLSDD